MMTLDELQEMKYEKEQQLRTLEHRLTEVPESRHPDPYPNVLTSYEAQIKPTVRNLITEAVEDIIDIESLIGDLQ